MISSASIVKALTDKRVKGEISHEKMAEKLIYFLKKNHFLGLVPAILKRLEKHVEKERKNETIFVITSHEFSSGLMKEIERRVGSLNGKNVERIVDPKIIGGFKVKNGYKIIDGSVVNNLKILKESLSKKNG